MGTGFTDTVLTDLTKEMEEFKTDTKPSNYIIDDNLKPDVWFNPKKVNKGQ